MTTTAGLTESSQATSQPTGLAAALASGSSSKSLQERIYQHLISKGEEGATDEVMATALAMNPWTQRPRRGALFTEGKFADSARRAVVWGVL